MGNKMTQVNKKNMEIWEQLEKTNPKYTKPVNKGWGPITTIDPMYQIKMMTNQFGPIGKGWSYHVNYHYTDKLIFAEVSIKYCLDAEWREFGPVCSVAPLGKNNGKLDDEAPKKAMTDALTKAFSHIGLCADVFLNEFDGNKYVIDDFDDQNSVKKTTGSTLNNNVANIKRRQNG